VPYRTSNDCEPRPPNIPSTVARAALVDPGCGTSHRGMPGFADALTPQFFGSF